MCGRREQVSGRRAFRRSVSRPTTRPALRIRSAAVSRGSAVPFWISKRSSALAVAAGIVVSHCSELAQENWHPMCITRYIFGKLSVNGDVSMVAFMIFITGAAVAMAFFHLVRALIGFTPDFDRETLDEIGHGGGIRRLLLCRPGSARARARQDARPEASRCHCETRWLLSSLFSSGRRPSAYWPWKARGCSCRAGVAGYMLHPENEHRANGTAHGAI